MKTMLEKFEVSHSSKTSSSLPEVQILRKSNRLLQKFPPATSPPNFRLSKPTKTEQKADYVEKQFKNWITKIKWKQISDIIDGLDETGIIEDSNFMLDIDNWASSIKLADFPSIWQHLNTDLIVDCFKSRSILIHAVEKLVEENGTVEDDPSRACWKL